MFRARIFRGNSGPAQNMASRLDETQNFASRLDETTGFYRFCFKNCQNLSRNVPSPIFRGNSGRAQNMASRLDETQNFVSRLDETTGFDRYGQICERVVSDKPRD